MKLRKKGAALQNIRRVSNALGRAAVLARGVSNKQQGRRLILKYSKLVKSALMWEEDIQGTDEEGCESLVRGLLPRQFYRLSFPRMNYHLFS